MYVKEDSEVQGACLDLYPDMHGVVLLHLYTVCV